jgi:hypothetical protein
MTLPVQTFQDRAARRREPKALREGHDAINDMLRRGRPTLDERHAERVMEDFEAKEQEFERREQGLDQGSRGGAAHRPEPTDPNDALRAAFREGRER